MVLKFLTLNANGLRQPVKRRAIFNYARARADIICLQETHSVQTDEQFWKFEWGAPIIFSHGDSNTKGVCILLRKGIEFKNQTIVSDEQGRFIICDIVIDEELLTVAAVYAPNKDTPKFFVNLFDQIIQKGNKFITLGDFNLALNKEIDRTGCRINNDKSASVINRLIEESIVIDVWRSRNENIKRWSYSRTKPTVASSHIDFVLASPATSQHITSVFYIPAIMTDHSAVFLSISMQQDERGRGYWKLNNAHLIKPEFLEVTNNMLERKTQEYAKLNPLECWECLKFDLANMSQDWSRQYASEKTLIISQLFEKVAELEEQLSEEYCNQTNQILVNTKADLDELEFEKAKGVMFRTKARYMIEGERNTKYYFGLEKTKSAAKKQPKF